MSLGNNLEKKQLCLKNELWDYENGKVVVISWLRWLGGANKYVLSHVFINKILSSEKYTYDVLSIESC